MPEPLTVDALAALIRPHCRTGADAQNAAVIALGLIGDRYVPRAEHDTVRAEVVQFFNANEALGAELTRLRAAVLDLAKHFEDPTEHDDNGQAAELRALTEQDNCEAG